MEVLIGQPFSRSSVKNWPASQGGGEDTVVRLGRGPILPRAVGLIPPRSRLERPLEVVRPPRLGGEPRPSRERPAPRRAL
jgi:hypothetical protein